MERQDLKEVKGWTVVTPDGKVYEVVSFDEANKIHVEVGGSLMTTEFYQTDWKPLHS